MHPGPAFTTAVAAVGLGIAVQLFAHRYRLPALVLLLLAGVLAGPDGAGLLRPESLGEGLSLLVKLAVAVVLFEGALALRVEDLGRAIQEVRRLVSLGALVTWLGAGLAAYLLAGLSAPASALFGSLVVVTGPTVVQPMLRRLALPRRLKAVLEGEAILIDPVGAILAVVVYEAVVGGEAQPGRFVAEYLLRVGVGTAVGAAFGLALPRLLKSPRWVPLEFANVTVLAAVLVAYGVAESLVGEAGIAAAVAMGLVIQRGAIPEEHRLRRFKEQITLLLISVLFLLLAADLPVALIERELAAGVAVAATLALLVRPVAVFASLVGSPLSWRERLFAAAVGPRGIVAASAASLFALSLPGEGERLLALVFITIFVTVALAGVGGPLLARVLGLTSPGGRLALVVGAGGIGRTVARLLADRGRPVVLVDRNPHRVREAMRERLEVVRGSALDEDVLEEAGAQEAGTFLAVTTNPEVNLLACQIAREVFAVPRVLPALDQESAGLAEILGGGAAFSGPVDLEDWDHALSHRAARVVSWKVPTRLEAVVSELDLPDTLLPLVRVGPGGAEVVHSRQRWEAGDEVIFASRHREEETLALLSRLLEPAD